MSHFVVGVVLPRSMSAALEKGDYSEVKATITKLMAPYDETSEVPEYQKKCWCVGRAAKNAAWKHAEGLYGPNPYQGKGAEHWQSWKARMEEAEASFLETRADRETPDSACDECGGTGMEKSTYNPLSKWDWCRVGGRWDGFMAGVERPETENGFNFSDQHEEVRHNIALVDDVLKRACESDGDDWCPFALVTPEMLVSDAPAQMAWHERGKMGWFGISTNEKDKDEWRNQARFILSECMGHYIVGVDCHI